KPFQRWIMTEVIPSVRRNGGYILGQNDMDATELANAAKQVAQNVLSEQDRRIQDLRLENEARAALLREWEPKIRYHDAILQSQGAIPISVLAKEYGFSAQRLNSYLHERGIQYKCAGTWLLYQPYADRGYTQTRAVLNGSRFNKLHTNWTPKGCAFLYDFLRKDGILPLSERMNVSEDIEDTKPL
ncbi:MAG: phage antirepressor KilAC domain-containing protein, partial [Oscillospiraceae bacterium]|nr:phage antirepressor KilAC domain-containing protein [Oscillospiraceae bacterium]